MKLVEKELNRFRKQQLLPFMGRDGLIKLKDTAVLVVGLGGGGCAASLQLATSNVGKLILCDFDIVGESNLGRQFLHNESTIGIDKVVSAKIALKAINPFLDIETIAKPISEDILKELNNKYENLAIFVAVDKFEAHYLINNFCILNNVPAVHIAQLGYKGFVYTYDPQRSTTCIEHAIKQGFNKDINESSFDAEEQDLPYFAPIISIVCSIAIIEIIKMRIGANEKSMANIFCIFRAIEHEDIFETKQTDKPFFEELQLVGNINCSKCNQIK
jgi:molybdopterin/thiamine biosynthesis adenylyltransferase